MPDKTQIGEGQWVAGSQDTEPAETLFDRDNWSVGHRSQIRGKTRPTAEPPKLPEATEVTEGCWNLSDARITFTPTRSTPDSISVASSYQDDDQTPRSKQMRMVPEWGNPPAATSSRRKAGPQLGCEKGLCTAVHHQGGHPSLTSKILVNTIGELAPSDSQKKYSLFATTLPYCDVFKDFFYKQATPAGDGIRTALGPTPSVAAVLDIMERGISCCKEQMDEAGWNQIVHS
ncbi:hypothetical protein CT0861_13197 [Colletotrichum tofieldiae]|uniref:Uncharacterized protein n=1 Tax=Colletotrichum tofieldiae TaxID=708197 RepID=A0A166LR96_9PEZI|nr:hypothetical protein CT0861_13197 [Colletotrichum tofieldiae]